MNVSVRILLSTLGCLAIAAQAQQPEKANTEVYRCRDANGQLRIGTALPQECLGRDTEVVNQRGTVVRMIEGAGTRSARMNQEATEAAKQKLIDDQIQRDKVLIETYLSVEEIERLRDQRLDLLMAQLKVAEQHIGTLRDRLTRLRDQSKRFKPYSGIANSPPLPDHIAEDLVGTVKSIMVDTQTIDIKRDEQATMTTNFDRDIKRFKELKGIK
ncbi:MAG TPA: hypothetical protein VK629_09960 [Steroidobacteraceae bacterium]|nr:hypothetical protein [Steroidobacteraceae bacterium]